MVPPTRRLPMLERLIAQRSYFVLHAPRQVGKTTAMIALAQELTASGRYASALVSVEAGLVIANPIYREVLPRVLTVTPSTALPQIAPSWLTPEGSLDTNTLLQTFLDFWLQHGEPLLKSTSYPEIAPHLVLMAFLHRVVNGGGTLEREYAMTYGRSETIGRDRMDLCLRYGAVVLGIELKVRRTHQVDPLTKGLAQLDSYLARLSQDTGWLVIFDRRSNAPELVDGLESVRIFV
jgi:hypothetical protein